MYRGIIQEGNWTREGTTPITEQALPAGTKTRHIKIEQTGEFSLFWSVHELSVYVTRMQATAE